MTIYSMHWMTLTYKYKAQDLYLVKTKCHLIDKNGQSYNCLLYTSDAADDWLVV